MTDHPHPDQRATERRYEIPTERFRSFHIGRLTITWRLKP